MTTETQYCYARYGSKTLCKREHNTETGEVTAYVDCAPAEQAAYEAAFKKKKDALRIEIKAAEAKKIAEAAKNNG